LPAGSLTMQASDQCSMLAHPNSTWFRHTAISSDL
jgi:hypothetical protein